MFLGCIWIDRKRHQHVWSERQRQKYKINILGTILKVNLYHFKTKRHGNTSSLSTISWSSLSSIVRLDILSIFFIKKKHENKSHRPILIPAKNHNQNSMDLNKWCFDLCRRGYVRSQDAGHQWRWPWTILSIYV